MHFCGLSCVQCGRLNTELHSLLSLREHSSAPGPQLLDLLSSRSPALRTLLFKPRGPPGLTRSLLALRKGGYAVVVKEAMHAWASGEEGELQAKWRAEVSFLSQKSQLWSVHVTGC